ncbi:MAG: ethanolamine utilization protein EutD [bacterium]|nr:MAG: ethanolamine utilization protein EutD [bacterium]
MSHKNAVILLFLIAVGVALGGLCGWFFGESMLKVAWIGELFLNLLKMVIVPLIVSAVISGVVTMGSKGNFERIGGLTILYYMCTTGIAVFIGLVMVNIIRPGEGLNITAGEQLAANIAAKQDTGFSDIILSMVSPNLVKSAVENQLLPIILFSIVFAIALNMLGERGRPVAAFFESVNEAMMKIVTWIMYLAPIGIFALIAGRLGQAGGGAAFFNEIKAVGWHVVTVLSGLAIHFLALFAILYFVTGRGWSYFTGMLRALLTAFGTASSSATLPLTMECARENRIDERASRFVLPLGSTVNMDGTALYEAAAVMFIAQSYGLEMGFSLQVIIFITATLAAIGAAGIPEAGLVTMVIVLQAVGLPLEGIALLLSVDWFLDRFRTSINVWGDSVGAAVIHKFLQKEPTGV